jgi:hypothetical protein
LIAIWPPTSQDWENQRTLKKSKKLPLRFTVDSTETKEKLMGNLKRLKDASPRLSDLCIGHDLMCPNRSREERRNMVAQAKQDSTDEIIHPIRSATGPCIFHRVRNTDAASKIQTLGVRLWAIKPAHTCFFSSLIIKQLCFD